MKYVKKPIPVEAVQWTGENINDVYEFMNIKQGKLRGGTLYISTLEGEMMCPIGSYIIKGVEGEFYPCREDVFNKTYASYKD